ncbi:MAG: hypothetical protein V4508_14525 [Pseudomonadota bacterium]
MHRHFVKAIVSTALVAASGLAHGQSIVKASVSKPTVQIGEELSLVIEFPQGVLSGWCGVRVDFGNGSSRDLRVGENGAADFPLRLAHRYPTPGSYTIRVTGQALSRGFRSAAACEGGERQVSVVVEDPVVKRLAEETRQRQAQIEQYEARIRQLEERERAARAAPAAQAQDAEIPKDQYEAKWCSTSESAISVCVNMNPSIKVSKARALMSRAACDAPEAQKTVFDAAPPASGTIYTFMVPEAAAYGCAEFVFFTRQ